MTDPMIGVIRRLKAIEDYLWKKKTFPIQQDISLTSAWTPHFVDLTLTGSPIITTAFAMVGNIVQFSIKIDPNGGTTASAGAYCDNLPYHALTGFTFYAGGNDSATPYEIIGNSIYFPSWVADGNIHMVSGSYELDSSTSPGALLLESGDFFLLESGDHLLLG